MKFEPLHHVTTWQLHLDGDSAAKMAAYRAERDREATRRYLERNHGRI